MIVSDKGTVINDEEFVQRNSLLKKQLSEKGIVEAVENVIEEYDDEDEDIRVIEKSSIEGSPEKQGPMMAEEHNHDENLNNHENLVQR
jgi:hypothetical protein